MERPARGSDGARGPRFDAAIVDGGYRWHYVDAVSDDGRWSIVVIALFGNPFSTAYARERARGKGRARALDHVALNVAIDGPQGRFWALTERAMHGGACGRSEARFGRSRIAWNGDALVIDVDEQTVPFPRALSGRIRLCPEVTTTAEFLLDRSGDHRWRPLAPMARVEVDLYAPGRISFRGHGYHDVNEGDVPLDGSFDRWTWSRARVGDRAIMTYDVTARGERSGPPLGLTTRPRLLVVDRFGKIDAADPMHEIALPPTRWRLSRSLRTEDRAHASVVRSLEDGPFYARDLVRSRLLGRETISMHETLSVARLRRGWVRFLAGFRTSRQTC